MKKFSHDDVDKIFREALEKLKRPTTPSPVFQQLLEKARKPK